ncbi:MAG: cytochrome b [Rhizomicrobium sp.]
MPARPLRYNTVAMSFHWIIAALLIANIALGLYMGGLPRSDPSKFMIIQTHKSIGLTVLVLSLLRLGWRLVNRVPHLPLGMHPVVAGLARFTHVFFYVLIIAIPLSGWLMVSASPLGNGTNYFGLFVCPISASTPARPANSFAPSTRCTRPCMSISPGAPSCSFRSM